MAAAVSHSVTGKSKGKQVPSRYLSPSPSPATTNASSTSISAPMTASPLPERSQSVNRSPPGGQLSQGNNVNAMELSVGNKMLTTSRKSLSVSFQGEGFSVPVCKLKAQEDSNLTERHRATPVRDHGENSKPVDSSKTRKENSGSNPLSRSLDHGSDPKVFRSGTMVVKSLQGSIVSSDGHNARRLSLDFGSATDMFKEANKQKPNAVSCDLAASDTDSVSSGDTNSCMQECRGRGLLKGRSVPRNIEVSARFWQETNNRLRRLQDPSLPFCTSPGSRIGGSAKFSSDGALSSLGTRPTSPSKLWTPSNLTFPVDIRRGKNREDRIVDAHVLRLLYNRYLQWRFANAKEDATFMTQKLSIENYLWSAWATTSELRHSVTLKRIMLLLLRHKLKFTSILKGQIAHLEAWTLLERDHSSSLLGATEALKASTLRLPVVGKALADIQNLKNAISSAGDVMQAIASSICAVSSKVEEMNSLVAKLASETTKERVLLEQCNDFLSVLAAIQCHRLWFNDACQWLDDADCGSAERYRSWFGRSARSTNFESGKQGLRS
ncbi:hypothetical protein V6N13_005507 [Hibiscus sabdariffa]|uniref:QWRF motif-containing protein 2-like n=1 Tax=Hibiscus sabdariffa TaxID=183260 RepID=A0ABR2ESF3_9ROSI